MALDPNAVVLPKAMSEEGSNLFGLTWLLYGYPGIGKTTFGASMGRALLLYAEPGHKFVKCAKRPILSWSQFKAYVIKLKDNPDAYDMILIDPVDALFRMCRQAVCKKRGIEHQSDEQWGKGWDMVHDEFEGPISTLTLLNMGVCFISHAKTVEVRGRVTKTSKIMPSVPSQGLKIISKLCDVVAYMGYSAEAADSSDGSEPRELFFKPTETMEAKDRTGALPARIVVPRANGFAAVAAHLLSSPLIREDSEVPGLEAATIARARGRQPEQKTAKAKAKA